MLEDMVTRFPYCQSGQMLLACNYFIEKNNQYPAQLKKAAAYAGDRNILKNLIGLAKKAESIPAVIIPVPLPPVVVPFHEPEVHFTESEVFTYDRMTPEELLSIVKKRLAEIDAEKKREQITSPEQGLKETVQVDTATPVQAPDVPLSKASLIEKFILEDPRISKPKATFFNPGDSAFRSNFDEEEIVSETLAQLYAQQGNIQKAIHIYDKLSLINQEKSRYFAAQIEKLSP